MVIQITFAIVFATTLIIYILCAIVTFGHAWHRLPDDVGQRFFGTVAACTLWPLYWSEVAWGKVEK